MKNSILKGIVATVLMIAVPKISVFYEGSTIVYAKDTDINVVGKLYEFGEKSEYEYSSGTATEIDADSVKLGTFSISGDVKAIADVNGFRAYQVQHTDVTERNDAEGIVKLSYELGNILIGSAETDWHIIDDKTAKVDGEKLDEKILSGSIILQTSLDGETWITDVVKTNIAGDESDFEPNFYDTKGIQQVNGCYYRVIVVYKSEKRVEDTKIGPVTKKNYENKKCAEIYEFYLIDSMENAADATAPTATPRKELGKRINTGKDNGFSGNESITDEDPHFGWDIGTFYLNGYTREQFVSGSEEPVFLKTVGDRVTLWFHLKEDINCLNGSEKLSINEDENGYDQYFGVEKTNFKHGVFIIQFTDFEGRVHEPVIYTDYLAASARTGADTKVELFEEGDYEVALDYEIKDSSGFNSYTNYRIFFKFNIRNGNCMVYPFDVNTGAELSDNALTENGFKLDLAKSRYLTIDIVKSAVKKVNGRYFLDTRVNTATQEGKIYTEEGIYTFTVKNPSTEESTKKTIYVGSSPIYRALAGGQTIESVNELLNQGGQLQDDGSIFIPVQKEPEELDEVEPEEIIAEEDESEKKGAVEVSTEVVDKAPIDTEIDNKAIENNVVVEQEKYAISNAAIFGVIGIVVVIIILILAGKRNVSKRKNENNTEARGNDI